jgi:hypothetical protein
MIFAKYLMSQWSAPTSQQDKRVLSPCRRPEPGHSEGMALQSRQSIEGGRKSEPPAKSLGWQMAMSPPLLCGQLVDSRCGLWDRTLVPVWQRRHEVRGVEEHTALWRFSLAPGTRVQNAWTVEPFSVTMVWDMPRSRWRAKPQWPQRWRGVTASAEGRPRPQAPPPCFFTRFSIHRVSSQSITESVHSVRMARTPAKLWSHYCLWLIPRWPQTWETKTHL